MKLKCLGSSSKGNCYLLTSSTGETLILDAGVPVIEVKKSLNFDLSKVVGCLITHVHGDHASRIKEYCNSGIDCFVEIENKEPMEKHGHRVKYFASDSKFGLGSFKVKAFDLIHDVPCVGYYIWHPEMGFLVFATDTMEIPYHFKQVNHFLIEANYSNELIDSNVIVDNLDMFLRERILKSHLSIEQAMDFVRGCDTSKTKNIILCHLSGTNSDAKAFQEVMSLSTGKPVHVAEKGTEINLNFEPF